MANTTKLSGNDIQYIADQFGVEYARHSPLDGGLANSSYILETPKSKYVLTACNAKNMGEISNLVDLLLVLEEKDFPTTRLVKTKSDEYVIEYNANPIILKRFIEGEVPTQIDALMTEQVGKAIAQLHAIEFTGNLPSRRPYGLDFFSKVIDGPIVNDYTRWLSSQMKYLQDNISKNLPKGLIHGDVLYENTLFQDDKFMAIIDFEEACYYYKVFDLGVPIVGTYINEGNLDFEAINGLIKGYQSIRELENEEIEQLKLFVEYASTLNSIWRFWEYNIRKPDNLRKDMYKETVSIAQSVQNMSSADFLDAMGLSLLPTS